MQAIELDETSAADAIEDNSSDSEDKSEEVEDGGYESGSTLVLGQYVPSVPSEDMSDDEVPPPLEDGTCESLEVSPLEGGPEPHNEELEPSPSTSASDHANSPLSKSKLAPRAPSMAPELKTPESKGLLQEDLFNTPEVGNMSQSIPRAELVEMCIALMQYFGEHHPEILKFFGFQ